MPVVFCPNCKKRVVVGFDCTDVIHDCTSNPDTPTSISQEDVVVIGDWEDYSGSGTKPAQEVMRQGLGNELQGTRAGLMGANKDAETRRGNIAATHRQRAHLEYIEVTKGDRKSN